MLSDPVIGMCSNKTAITNMLAQVAWETGYYSTVYQPKDGGAGLIHMIPANWSINAADMDKLWPGNDYVGKVKTMGASFFQDSRYGWRSLAAWYKLTNRVISGCGLNLFTQSYDVQTKCIFGQNMDRSESLGFAKTCMV